MKKVVSFRFGDLSMIAVREEMQTKVSIFWCDEHKEDMFFMEADINKSVDMALELVEHCVSEEVIDERFNLN